MSVSHIPHPTFAPLIVRREHNMFTRLVEWIHTKAAQGTVYKALIYVSIFLVSLFCFVSVVGIPFFLLAYKQHVILCEESRKLKQLESVKDAFTKQNMIVEGFKNLHGRITGKMTQEWLKMLEEKGIPKETFLGKDSKMDSRKLFQSFVVHFPTYFSKNDFILVEASKFVAVTTAEKEKDVLRDTISGLKEKVEALSPKSEKKETESLDLC